jgi:hypothetical protein
MSETDSTTSSISEYNDNINHNNMLDPIPNGNFELCMLRFIHIMFSENNVMCHNMLHQYMEDNEWCNSVKDYFYEFPGVMMDKEFYTTPTGKNICDKWTELMSYRPFLSYNRNGYDVVPDISNFYNFIYNTFPLLEKSNSTINQIKLRAIYSMLNSRFDVVVGQYMKCLPGNQVHKGIVQSIYIDNKMHYIWELSCLIEVDDMGKETTLYSESELRKI